MIARARALHLGAAATLAAAVLVSGVQPAAAGVEPYLGWDFGGGFGIGVGTPPSAYDPCPTYGWPVYPYACRYSYYRTAYHSRAHHRRRHYRHHYH